MAECSTCGKSDSMPFRCKFCGKKFCSEHRLPENHKCGGLEEYKERKKEESVEVTYDAQKEEERFRKHTIRRKQQGLLDRLKRKLGSIFSPERKRRSYNTYPGQRRKNFTGAMRQSFPEIATFSLLGVIAVGFVLQLSLGSEFTRQFALIPSLVFQEPWRIVTSLFLHGGTGHLLVNSLVLFFFGSELERRIGTKRFLKLFFLAGIVASLGFAGFIQLIGCSSVGGCPAVGASGALYGVFAALAIIAPEITVLAFFVIPMRIRTALVAFALFDVFLLTQNTPIASSAHLAGLLVGLYYGFKLDRDLRSKLDLTMF